jgi:hypothetical protein
VDYHPEKSYGLDDDTPLSIFMSHHDIHDDADISNYCLLNSDQYSNRDNLQIFTMTGEQLLCYLVLTSCSALPFSGSFMSTALLLSSLASELACGSVATFLEKPLPLAAENVTSPSGL